MTSGTLIAAQKIFPSASPFVDYIEELNQVLAHLTPSANIQLRRDNDQPAYTRFVSRLFIAWPRGNKVVSGLSKDTITTTSVPIDDILSEVIRNSLRRYQSYQQSQQKNVICVGFSVGSENGTCSVLRDLDARSPSASIQILRAPAARELLKRVGPVLFRHILMYSVLLLDTDPSKEINSKEVSMSSGLSFIQLCGPSPLILNISKRANTARTVSNVVIRQDILYRDATVKRRALPEQLSITKTVTGKSAVYYNDGLPASHHLQGIDHSNASATYLLKVIQSIRSTENAFDTDRKSNNRVFALRDKPWVNDYETNASLLRSRMHLHNRGKAWLKNKRVFPPRLRQLRATLRKVIEKTHSNQFRKILGRVCFLDQSLKCKVHDEPKLHTEKMIDMCTPAKDVAIYIVTCTQKMFPHSLFGSTRNQRIFEKAIHELIRRRSQRDRFHILQYFKQSGFAISEVPWLHHRGVNGKSITNPTDLRFRQKAVDDLLIWTIRGVVIPILLHSFYVTETSRHRYRVFYYRREIWNHLIHRSMRETLRNNKQFAILRRDQLIEFAKHRKSNIVKLGRAFFPHEVLFYNILRYIPKTSSLRGIQKPCGKMLLGFQGLQRKSLRGYEAKRSAKRIRPIQKSLAVFQLLMKNITKIVSYEGRKYQPLRGSSVFSLDDVYEKLLSFKRQWINASKPVVYACCMDISKSFDTIPLDFIFSKIIPNIFSRDRYVLVKYRQNWCDSLSGNIKSKTTTHVCNKPGEEASFTTLIRRKHSHSRFGGIYTDLSSVTTLNTDDIISILDEHLKTNIVSVPRHCRSRSESAFAIQSQGLPQGHPLSSWLTSFLYAYIETTDLSKFIEPPVIDTPSQVNVEKDQRNCSSVATEGSNLSLLMRMVDDWAYFSFDKSLTEKFMNRMKEGWSNSHGFSINVGKTKLSRSLESSGTQMIPWCGLLIDSSSIEVRVDYARYDVPGARLRNSHVIEYQEHPGKAFADKAWSCFRPKLHPLLLDEQINSRSTILLNVYQAAVLTSLKACAYAIETGLRNENFFTEVLKVTISKFATLVYQLKTSKVAKTNSYRFPLSMRTIRFIYVHAILAAIKNKLGQYHGFKALSVYSVSILEHEYLKEKQNLDKYGETSTIQLIEQISREECEVLWNLRL